MPIEVKAYRCKWKCKKVLITKQAMKHHEGNCFWNPEKKACMTCGNYTNAPYDYDDGFEMIPWCDGFQFDLIENNMKYNCEKWIPKQENTDEKQA